MNENIPGYIAIEKFHLVQLYFNYNMMFTKYEESHHIFIYYYYIYYYKLEGVPLHYLCQVQTFLDSEIAKVMTFTLLPKRSSHQFHNSNFMVHEHVSNGSMKVSEIKCHMFVNIFSILIFPQTRCVGVYDIHITNPSLPWHAITIVFSSTPPVCLLHSLWAIPCSENKFTIKILFQACQAGMQLSVCAVIYFVSTP